MKRTLPTFAKCGNPQRALQLIAGMSWQIQKCINLGYGDPLRTVSNFYDIIARANFSLLQHAKVKSWSVMCYEQGRHARFIHSNPDAVARYAWLGHFKFSVTDAVSIAYTDLVISKPFDGEVFSELAKDEVITSENAFPVVI